MTTQTERIVTLLRVRGEEGVTPLDALDEIGSFRLAARISDARDLGSGLLRENEEIVTERVTRDGKTYARYVLRKRLIPGVVQTALWDGR